MPYNINKITKFELSYYAGFFDGEGCIMISKKRASRPCRALSVVITNTRVSVLEDIKGIFGGGLFKVRRGKESYKDKWMWSIGGKKAVAFLTKIYPYLRLKKKEAELAFEFQRGKTCGKSDALKERKDIIEEAQYTLMRELKK